MLPTSHYVTYAVICASLLIALAVLLRAYGKEVLLDAYGENRKAGRSAIYLIVTAFLLVNAGVMSIASPSYLPYQGKQGYLEAETTMYGWAAFMMGATYFLSVLIMARMRNGGHRANLGA